MIHGGHLHKHCDHCVHYCRVCNATYCCKCGEEWGRYIRHPYPWFTENWMWDGSGTQNIQYSASTADCTHSHGG